MKLLSFFAVMMMCASLASAAETAPSKKKKTSKKQTTTAVTAAPVAEAETAPSILHSSNKKITASAMLGYGFTDGMKLGLGVRGGYDLEQNFYVGGTFIYHLGSSSTVGGIDAKASMWFLGAEGGYNYQAKPEILVRPYLGVGFATASATVNSPALAALGIAAGNTSASSSSFAIWPGVNAMYALPGTQFFAGLDARFYIVSNSNAFATYASFGMRL